MVDVIDVEELLSDEEVIASETNNYDSDEIQVISQISKSKLRKEIVDVEEILSSDEEEHEEDEVLVTHVGKRRDYGKVLMDILGSSDSEYQNPVLKKKKTPIKNDSKIDDPLNEILQDDSHIPSSLPIESTPRENLNEEDERELSMLLQNDERKSQLIGKFLSDSEDENISFSNETKGRFGILNQSIHLTSSQNDSNIKPKRNHKILISGDEDGDSELEVDKENRAIEADFDSSDEEILFKNIDEKEKSKNDKSNNRLFISSSLPSDPINESFDISFNKSPINKRLTTKSSIAPIITKTTTRTIKKTKSDVTGYLSNFTKKDLTKVNKVKRNKTEVSSEIIMNIDDEFNKLLGTTFGQLNSEFSPSLVRIQSFNNVLIEHKSSLEIIKEKHLEGVNIDIPNIPSFNDNEDDDNFKIVTWSQLTNKIYSETHQCFLPLNEELKTLTKTVGIYYDAEDFVFDYESGKFLKILKDFKKKYLPKPFKQIILILKGYNNVLSKARRKVNQEYTQEVRNLMEGNNNNVTKKKNSKKRQMIFNEEQIESMIIDLQIEEKIHCFHINSTADMLTWLKTISYSIGVSFYDEYLTKDNEFSTTLGPIKAGDDGKTSYKNSLEQLKFVTDKTASRIVEKYSSFNKLYEGITKKNKLGIARDGKSLVNESIESTILKLFKSDDPDELLLA